MNIVRIVSAKCKRVVRSVLAAEFYVFLLGLDQGFTILSAVQRIFKCNIKLKLILNSNCLFDLLTSLNTSTEERLLIDVSMLLGGEEERDISEIL